MSEKLCIRVFTRTIEKKNILKISELNTHMVLKKWFYR